MATYDRVCKICGTAFQTIYKSKIYCSVDCRYEGDRRRTNANYHKKKAQKQPIEPMTCAWCGKVWTPENRLKQKYCSNECQRAAQRFRSRLCQHKNYAISKTCAFCMGPIPDPCKGKKYCSDECREKAEVVSRRHRRNEPVKHLRPATTKKSKSLSAVARDARAAGLTYGEYMARRYK